MSANLRNDPIQESSENEPLLGRPGDATQESDNLTSMAYNVFLGTAIVAQAGIWILTGIVWGSVFSTKVMLFSAHPLLNSAGLLFITQAILVLQPTSTQKQKIAGAYTHSALNNIGVLLLIAGLVVIEYNKIKSNGKHFYSLHGRLGLVTYCLFAFQALVGLTVFFTPKLYGSVANAKSLYKYHRMSGYLVLILGFATVAAATTTTFNKQTLHIQLWAVIVAALITLVGIVPRIKKTKLGF